MKQYFIEIPDRLKGKKEEIKEFILAKHYTEAIFGPGFCGKVLNIDKFTFQTDILSKFKISFVGKEEL